MNGQQATAAGLAAAITWHDKAPGTEVNWVNALTTPPPHVPTISYRTGDPTADVSKIDLTFSINHTGLAGANDGTMNTWYAKIPVKIKSDLAPDDQKIVHVGAVYTLVGDKATVNFVWT